MGDTLVSGNASPVTVAEMTTHLRLDGLDVQTDFLEGLIAAAADFVQTETRQQLSPATWRHSRDAFPRGRVLKLPKPPLRSVESVQYVDANGDTQTLSAGAYTVDAASMPGRIVLNDGQSWPDTADRPNAVTVEFAAGRATVADVPALLKLAVRLLAAHFYENREAVVTGTIATELPLALRSILDQNAYPEAV